MDGAPEKEESSRHWTEEGETSWVLKDESEFTRQISKGKFSRRGRGDLCICAGTRASLSPLYPQLTPSTQCRLTADISFYRSRSCS